MAGDMDKGGGNLVSSNLQADPDVTTTQPRPERISIQDASSWVLRVGVITSVIVMLTGFTLSLVQHPLTVAEVTGIAFPSNFGSVFTGIAKGNSSSIMELGVFLLVMTPVVRVFTAMVLFAVEDHDWLYTSVTFIVLVTVLSALIFLH